MYMYINIHIESHMVFNNIPLIFNKCFKVNEHTHSKFEKKKALF